MDSEKPMNMVCYICGRSNNDLETLINQQILEIDGKLRHLKGDLTKLSDKYSKYVQEILPSIKKNNLHDIPFNTILKDDSFRKKIPHFDDILSHLADSGYASPWESNRISIKTPEDKTLEDICNLFNETIKDNPKIVKIKKSISDLENKKAGLHDIHLLKKQINISKSSMEIEIPICPVCSFMFDEASQAAWKVIDDDDDD
ncbi:MAG: hypothetical protein PHU34_07650 [Candidatus Methanoperedens sp.]|nr:hypothetical protein [Candidatus Methanoperedens sp.]